MHPSAGPPMMGQLPTAPDGVGGSSPQQTAYATNIARSLTIDEMRDLHRRAVYDAEAKRTELRLVLASRYRELVGSSDEVLHMQKRAGELDGLVQALPVLVEKLVRCAEEGAAGNKGSGVNRASSSLSAGSRGSVRGGELTDGEAGVKADRDTAKGKAEEEERRRAADRVVSLRRSLASLPRSVHRSLDSRDVHGAASDLVSLFGIVSTLTDSFPLSNALRPSSTFELGAETKLMEGDALLRAQVKMMYLHVQTLPSRTVKMARKLLLRSAMPSSGKGEGGIRPTAEVAARALSALDLLDAKRSDSPPGGRANKLVDLYFDSKASLVRNLLSRLKEGGDAASDDAADDILSRIVAILQYDIILHPYQIFVLRRFLPSTKIGASPKVTGPSEFESRVISSLPPFDPTVVKSKASNFLASFLPLIRTKVKSVLMSIAGTTAARLGGIRQSLYDKTDGVDRMRDLDENGLCRWEEAVSAIVDGRIVSAHGTTAFVAAEGSSSTLSITGGTGVGSAPPYGAVPARRFSLWSALFSSTFSNLVHSILSTSFHSVHSSVVSSLRSSLSAAPPLRSILPHEAHRNALRIATDLDRALRKVSDDAHELLVHAEEREESERRLRQSLYVQTCEIMGRLLNELRRMLPPPARGAGDGVEAKEEDATTELIVGRLCYLLKFRLTSLPTLLDPANSPAAISAAAAAAGGGSGGREAKLSLISLEELRGAFELADDDDDGLISLEEAMEAAESAFSGTSFLGAEMVRDTLLLSPSTSKTAADEDDNEVSVTSPRNVTLPELVLLSSRGLRHSPSGSESALGTVQASLDLAVLRCFAGWARAALRPTLRQFRGSMEAEVDRAAGCSDVEWRRLHGFPAGSLEEEKKDEDTCAAVGGVSSHVTAYLLSLSAAFHQSVCPSDSLPPVPSLECADSLGVFISEEARVAGVEGLTSMMKMVRSALLSEATTSVSRTMHETILAPESVVNDDSGNEGAVVEGKKLDKCGGSALVQLLLDVGFVKRCFFERNFHGFGAFGTVAASSAGVAADDDSEVDEIEEESVEGVDKAHEILSNILAEIRGRFDRDGELAVPADLDTLLNDRHLLQLRTVDLFLSSLFGEDRSAPASAEEALADASAFGASSLSMGGTVPNRADGTMAASSLLNPLHSARRFALLPIQAERSLQELQMRGKFGKEKEDRKEADGGSAEGYGGAVTGAVSSGFGFFSNMLKKK
eukprot:CAMPEP_0113544010 /NCGR_PEP_ID=MMETSP0015_2-20120614/10470_1 /TAXON_ID=2838 /ORGANISM="Odontella" /LENGTH=1214 /DNA_ID=CAMNT_0000444221 /DNA_START=247 /DNA_END=3891 /DNA_ORIENTATION=+ /assembly_acc=CAM_ASM_000160